MKFFIAIYFSVISLAFSQTTYYVNQENGLDTNDGLTQSSAFKSVTYAATNNNILAAGDTLVLIGEFSNPSYNENYNYSGNINDSHIWHQENSIRINNLNGSAGNYITVKPLDNNTILKGDGANIFRITNSSYLKIEDFNIEGEVVRIPLQTAEALQFLYREQNSNNTLYRVPVGTSDADVENMTFPILSDITRPSYTDTRGFYLSNVHHIDITNLTIHDMPGGGLRVSNCDYINIIGNEIYAVSRKSYSGTHGLVVTNANSQIQGTDDTNDGYKINILRNKVHHNYNEIYSWAPTKTIITPHIDEGKGISLQRNDIDDNDTPTITSDDTGWLRGRFLVANNLCYFNGFSGLHSNDGTRIDFINNTAYLNSYTKSVYLGITSNNGGNIGISAQGGSDIKFLNNISIIDSGLNKSALSSNITDGLVVQNNLIYGSSIDGTATSPISENANVANTQINELMDNPQFENVSAFNFRLKQNSPARGHANSSAPSEDFSGMLRDANPDIGAYEYSNTLSTDFNIIEKINISPNPFCNYIDIQLNQPINFLKLYTLDGKQISMLTNISIINENRYRVNLEKLKLGMYLLNINKSVIKIIKK